MPVRGIHHVDLAVTDVDDSLAFYLDLLGPLGWAEDVRSPTYRGTEEVVYLREPRRARCSGSAQRTEAARTSIRIGVFSWPRAEP